ncbi:hypothetical protein ACU686_39895 [Yinghuangia aomiensis]
MLRDAQGRSRPAARLSAAVAKRNATEAGGRSRLKGEADCPPRGRRHRTPRTAWRRRPAPPRRWSGGARTDADELLSKAREESRGRPWRDGAHQRRRAHREGQRRSRQARRAGPRRRA